MNMYFLFCSGPTSGHDANRWSGPPCWWYSHFFVCFASRFGHFDGSVRAHFIMWNGDEMNNKRQMEVRDFQEVEEWERSRGKNGEETSVSSIQGYAHTILFSFSSFCLPWRVSARLFVCLYSVRPVRFHVSVGTPYIPKVRQSFLHFKLFIFASQSSLQRDKTHKHSIWTLLFQVFSEV